MNFNVQLCWNWSSLHFSGKYFIMKWLSNIYIFEQHNIISSKTYNKLHLSNSVKNWYDRYPRRMISHHYITRIYFTKLFHVSKNICRFRSYKYNSTMKYIGSKNVNTNKIRNSIPYVNGTQYRYRISLQFSSQEDFSIHRVLP